MYHFECKYCAGHKKNVIGEDIVFCELYDEWMNVTLGDCINNCESQKALFEWLKDDNGD